MQQHSRANPNRRATHRGQNGLFARRNGTQESKYRRVFCRRRVVQKIFNVVTRTEHGLVPLNEQYATRRIGVGAGDRLRQLGVHAGCDRVFTRQTVERDRGNAL
jgi:hypothetical protein